MNEDKSINDKGFVVRPKYYNQEQWCEMYLTVIRMYKILYKEHEQLKTTNESLTSLVNSCQNKIRQVQNNWNELNKFIDENIKSLEEEMTNKKCDNAVAIYGREMNGFFKVRRKMQELEGNNEKVN